MASSTRPSSVELAISCLEGFKQSWVLFSHGTVVTIPNAVDESTVKEEAIKLLKEYGPVYAGTPHGDFNVLTCQKGPGWMVTSHHSSICTFVGLSDIQLGANDLQIGLFGRNNRHLDSQDLEVILVHLESSPN